MKSPYDVLGVPSTASQEEIRKAYRALAKKCHPDLHPGDKQAEDRFKEVTAAYDFLSDTETRARFDRGEIDAGGAERRERAFWRAYGDGSAGAGYAPFGDEGASGFGAEDVFADAFGRFGGGARAQFRMQGADVSYTLRCAFLDAVNGASKRLTFPDGKSLDVAIPKGTRDRQTLRLKGQGMPGIGGGPPGDAYVEVHVEPHAFFTRKDDDIQAEVPVTLAEAVLGARIRVPTVDGPVTLTVPRGSNSGSTLRLRGKGVPAAGGGRGDQYVTLKVVLPDPPDEALTEFLRTWEPAHPDDVRGKAGMA